MMTRFQIHIHRRTKYKMLNQDFLPQRSIRWCLGCVSNAKLGCWSSSKPLWTGGGINPVVTHLNYCNDFGRQLNPVGRLPEQLASGTLPISISFARLRRDASCVGTVHWRPLRVGKSGRKFLWTSFLAITEQRERTAPNAFITLTPIVQEFKGQDDLTFFHTKDLKNGQTHIVHTRTYTALTQKCIEAICPYVIVSATAQRMTRPRERERERERTREIIILLSWAYTLMLSRSW
jgi:hypothetical protein